ncbi:MAG TPA: LysR family transcriptional regulator [Steroidobacteraceae bacterium]|jgi:DNA-binding transcriptional LysR family regulator|nr:LysR family transcriptional regulator [Steroidobacteraceae bacterium]
MDIEELNTFLEVIRTQSLVTAARHLHVTPSTVTARISTLEEKLGQKLLHRRKSGAILTAAGFKFQRYAELMTQVWRQARYEVALPPGVEGVCNVGLEFDLWHNVGSRFLDHVRAHAPGIATAMWPGEQRQLQRWLDMGLIDTAFCYVPHAGAEYTSRLLLEDELILVSASGDHSAALDSAYVYVDHGDQFRRQHAEAFPEARPSPVTIAASDWALEYLLRTDSKGYLPARVVGPLIASGRLHRVEEAPSFLRRVYLVESARATQSRPWYEAAVAASGAR